ncbi:hypothetical protein, partial [Methylobacter sp.]|uniref:hypothetical protein n=1 Tax=Methylobacter sp. TaxID=2051955 RepID=UPI0025F361FE
KNREKRLKMLFIRSCKAAIFEKNQLVWQIGKKCDLFSASLKRLLLVLYLLHDPQGCGKCREMIGSFPVHAVVRGDKLYILMGSYIFKPQAKSYVKMASV